MSGITIALLLIYAVVFGGEVFFLFTIYEKEEKPWQAVIKKP